MFSTCTAIPLPTQFRACRLLARVTLLTVSFAWSATASAAVPWHPDLAAARRASEASQRPVLAIFTASWSSSSATLDRTTLASDEAVALITACFEPVCVDVDANPDTTRRLGISRVPTACIMSSQEQVLSKFELPETPAGFVAAAARAVQEAAVASAARSHQVASDVSAARRSFADVPDGGDRGLPTFGGDSRNPLRVSSTSEIRGTVPPGGQAINAVAAKVRMLSDFASDAAPAGGANDAIAASFRETSYRDGRAALPTTVPVTAPPAPTAAPVSPAESVASAAPAAAVPSSTTVETSPPAAPIPPATLASSGLPAAASAPPSEPAGAPLAGTVANKPLSIEPTPAAPSTSTAKSAGWLGLPQREQVAAAPAPQPTTSGAAAGRAPTATTPPASSQPLAAAQPSQPQTVKPEEPAKSAASGQASALADAKPQKPATSASSSLLSALQKPFTMFTKPTAPKTDVSKAAPGSTATAAATPKAAATPAAEPDAYGSMPVGMEGYCPVTLAERGVWVEGRAQWGVRHRGRTYLFASAEQQKAFLSDPDRYAPVLSGDDPVLALDAGKCTPGQRRYGVTYQSRTYLFSSSETRDAFAANPQRYTTGAMVAENRMPGNGNVIR